MMIKLLGAMMVILGCGGFGFAMCHSHRSTERELRQFIQALQWMEWELSCRLTPLPELCRGAAQVVTGTVRDLFQSLAQELETQSAPEAATCCDRILAQQTILSPELRVQFSDFGASLGQFDLTGQQRGLRTAIEQAQGIVESLEENRTQRLRTYQTLGLCAGAALAILFL